jgi:hypothetical protein
MESPPKVGKGQGYAAGGSVKGALTERERMRVAAGKAPGLNKAERMALLAKRNAPKVQTGGGRPAPMYETVTGQQAPSKKSDQALRNSPTSWDRMMARTKPTAAPVASAPEFTPPVPNGEMPIERPSRPIMQYKKGGKVPGYEMDRLPAKKPPGRGMDLAPSKRFKGEYEGYAKGGKVKGEKIAKVMREYKEGKLHSGSKKGPVVKNPKQAMAIALSEARAAKKAKGGEVFSDEYMAYESKGPKTRYTAAKGRRMAKERAMERRALDKARHAEKYAPGLSLDMSEYAKGGKVKHADVKMDKSMVKKAVHKHERAMHPGKPMTKLKHGGVPSYGRKAMYGGGKC